MNPLIGTQIANKYTLTKFLGEGGLGRVFLATHTVIGRTVAIKLLHPEFSNNPVVSARFALEAKAASKVSHPNTVNIHDYGTDTSGPTPQLYLAMEFLQGETLHDRIQQSPNRRLSPQEAVGILEQVLKPLAAFHRVGVVHRDLKPDNIMLCQDKGREQVKLLDFGIAKVTGSSLTATGQLLGTPQYMAPEQILAKKDMGPSVDIYAIGVILYEALAGDPPYLAESYMDVFRMHLQDRPMPLQKRLPNELWLVPFDKVIAKAMAHKPVDRYQSAEELQQAMAEALVASTALKENLTTTKLIYRSAVISAPQLPLEKEPTQSTATNKDTLADSFCADSMTMCEETIRMPQLQATLLSKSASPLGTSGEAPEAKNGAIFPYANRRIPVRERLRRLWSYLSRWWRNAA